MKQFIILIICILIGYSYLFAISNPASDHCVENGGRLEIRKNADGSEVGYCIFPDGTECEEWAFFRGEACQDKKKIYK